MAPWIRVFPPSWFWSTKNHNHNTKIYPTLLILLVREMKKRTLYSSYLSRNNKCLFSFGQQTVFYLIHVLAGETQKFSLMKNLPTSSSSSSVRKMCFITNHLFSFLFLCGVISISHSLHETINDRRSRNQILIKDSAYVESMICELM